MEPEANPSKLYQDESEEELDGAGDDIPYFSDIENMVIILNSYALMNLSLFSIPIRMKNKNRVPTLISIFLIPMAYKLSVFY